MTPTKKKICARTHTLEYDKMQSLPPLNVEQKMNRPACIRRFECAGSGGNGTNEFPRRSTQNNIGVGSRARKTEVSPQPKPRTRFAYVALPLRVFVATYSLTLVHMCRHFTSYADVGIVCVRACVCACAYGYAN